MTVTELPRHADDSFSRQTDRWQPARAGILNIWRYYDEVFEFHHGRLLLRGPNGSGKSKALELLLPFLFDASLRANRLSTFGTGERTMHWNLMGEGASGVTRVGYVWLEFRFPGTPERWFTCGARLQASSRTSTVHPDYFTTSQRIGVPGGISLVNDSGQPLTRQALEQRLGSEGTLYGNATDYRAEVRATLFPGLSEQRFDALILALLQLRMPKLSQRLDPSLLSDLLSKALPPLGQQEIADLAEGFERLDKHHERLKGLEELVESTRTLAARQRTYAQRVLRAGAGTLISATTEMEKRASTARESAARYETATREKEAAEQRIDELAKQIRTSSAHKTGLIESEAYQRGSELDLLRRRTGDAKSRAERLLTESSRKKEEAEKDGRARSSAEQDVRRRTEHARSLESEARQTAVRAGMPSVHGEIAAQLDGADPAAARPLLRAAVQSREEQLRAVDEALDGHERAVDRRGQAEEELEQARSAFSKAKEELDLAAEQRAAALEQLRTDVLAWAHACRELVFPEPDLLLDLVESERALNAEVENAVNTALQDITRQEASREALAAELRQRRDDRGTEIARLQAEKDLPPLAPPTRTADRTQMAGAPLWRLVDFSAASQENDRAGIEAALEGAGLLDAWVGSRGEVKGHDVFADPDALPAAAGRSLADVLSPEPGGEVAPAAVRRLLASVGFGDVLPVEGAAAIGADGSWRLGNLTGSWHKDRPAYIGAAARRRARERRIEELRNEILVLDGEIAEVEAELSALSLRRGTVRDERASLPPHSALDTAARHLDRAEIGLAGADRLVRERIELVGRREREVADSLRTLTACAAEYGMPAERSALANLAAATRAFRTACENWMESHDGLRSARQMLDSLATQAGRSAGDARQRAEEAGEAEEQYRELAATLEAVDSTAGAEYREVAAKIEKISEHLAELDAAQKSTQSRHTELAIEVGEWRNRRETDAAEHEKAVADRDAAALRFRRLASGVFPADSGLNDLERFETVLGASDGVRAALDAARLVAAAWPSVPHSPSNIGDALHRLSESMHTCRAVLQTRADLDLETDEDVQIFTAVVDGIRVGAAELLKILHGEAEESRREITERERELFDQTLTGDTRRHLAARIRQANELVENMNHRLEQVRTASKVAVRLVWQVATDLPPGTKAARDLLLKDPVRLTAADRESLHQFFRDRIEEAKADDTATGWEQQLAKVFDYTAWHRFVVKVDRANGEGWQLLTRKLHGALSGGEKAIALHLPLFAAVAAHYQAVPEAPRIILLDEVFVGVDTTNRGQVFALLSALDLDLMLTSDHEWCVYAELSGIGIHQLITGTDGDDAVTTARFTWDGHRLLSIDAE